MARTFTDRCYNDVLRFNIAAASAELVRDRFFGECSGDDTVIYGSVYSLVPQDSSVGSAATDSVVAPLNDCFEAS